MGSPMEISMSGINETLCIGCGQPSGSTPRLNHLPNGKPCPICRDRLLESLPPIFPGGEELAEELGTEEGETGDVATVWGPFTPDTPA